jgi:hypothetical protein
MAKVVFGNIRMIFSLVARCCFAVTRDETESPDYWKLFNEVLGNFEGELQGLLNRVVM